MRAWEELQMLREHAIDGTQVTPDQMQRYEEVYRRYCEWARDTEDEELHRWLTEKKKVICPTMRECMELAALTDVLRERETQPKKT